ncbi:MAG: hypothetical protein K2Q12_11045 [Rickettsiales bacterium]|nr:hypothetical protein [Rickettsiales bacterium]
MQHDPSEMARLFVDMWQEQMKQVMQDERYLNASLDMINKLQQTYSNDMTGLGEMMHAHSSPNSSRESAGARPRDTNNAAESASTSADEHDLLSLIAERLAISERRILELERQVSELKKRS